MFIQGYGIGFSRDPRVEAHPDPNTQSSVSLGAQLNPSGSFNLPHQGGGQTDGNDLSHSGETRWTLGIEIQPSSAFFSITYTILHFLKIFGLKNFFWSFLNFI